MSKMARPSQCDGALGVREAFPAGASEPRRETRTNRRPSRMARCGGRAVLNIVPSALRPSSRRSQCSRGQSPSPAVPGPRHRHASRPSIDWSARSSPPSSPIVTVLTRRRWAPKATRRPAMIGRADLSQVSGTRHAESQGNVPPLALLTGGSGPRHRPSGRRHLTVAPPSVARSGWSAEAAGKMMTTLLGRATACIGTGARDPEQLGSAIATLAVVRIAKECWLVEGANNGQGWHVRRYAICELELGECFWPGCLASPPILSSSSPVRGRRSERSAFRCWSPGDDRE